MQVFECMVEAGLPAGVANLVIGPAQEIGDEFLENPICRKISFTGSTEVGKQLMRGCADQVKRVSLELGGHAPFIVFPDADPEVGAKIAVTGKFRNNGQVCIAPSRFYVHKDVQKKFTEAAVEFAKQLEARQRSGRRRRDRADVREEGHAADDRPGRGRQEVRREGADRRQAQRPLRQGLLLRADGADRTCRGNARMMTEEPFAPVMPLLDFSKIDDVIAAANNTRYGLAAYVFTNDLTMAWKMAEGMEAGIIGINDPVPATPQCPFGGMKESGLGRELAHEGLEAYLETKYVSFKLREG